MINFNVFEKDNIKESTKKIYISNLKKIIKDYDINNLSDIDLLNKIKNDDKIKETTKKNKLNTIYIYLLNSNDDNDKKNIKLYREEIEKITKSINEQNEKLEKTEKENNNWLTIEEIKNKITSLKNIIDINKKLNLNKYTELIDYMKYISLLIHSKFNMRNDLSDAEILNMNSFKTNNTNINYILISKNKGLLILNNYKTNKTHGTKKYDIDDVLLKEIIKYYNYLNTYKKNNNINNNNFLIKENGDKITRNDYTRFINSIFSNDNKKIGTCILRKIFISDVWGNINEIKEIADKSQHTPQTALKYYVKK